MLLVVTALKLIAEVAMMVLLAQCVLGWLAGSGRHRNTVYGLLQSAGRPFIVLARLVSPRRIDERHLPVIALLLLALAWGTCTAWKIRICLAIGVDLCR